MDYQSIRQELKDGNLRKVFPLLLNDVKSAGNWELKDEIESLWTTYQQMLIFALNGIKDPEGEKIRRRICNKLAAIVAKLEQQERVKNNPSEKYSQYKKTVSDIYTFSALVSELEDVSRKATDLKSDADLRQSIFDYQMEKLNAQHEAAAHNLFYLTWTSSLWKNSDVDKANDFMFSDDIPSDDKSLYIAAVTLSLLEYLDKRKVFFLLDCYLIDDMQVAQRALVGVVIMLTVHYNNLKDNEELADRLQAFSLTPQFVSDIYGTMMQLQLSCTTDRVTSKMRDDIMPALLQGKFGKMGNSSLNVDELTLHDENPEWLDDAKVDKKIREMSEMQLDGADVYFSTFCAMKGYSFFQQMPHWFYHFNIDGMFAYPELATIKKSRIKNIINLMLNNGPFCNSDKFSLCFTFKQLGGMAEDAVEAQISEQLNGENVNDLISETKNADVKPSDVRRQYIFDLYRFYYCYPYKAQFPNPFEKLKSDTLSPLTNGLFRKMLLGSEKELNQYAEFLMRKEFYDSALHLFILLPKNDVDEKYASLWQRIGFCQQKLEMHDEAIKSYMTANALKPNSKWTLRHLASTLFLSKRYEEVIDVYKELLVYDQDNIKYLNNLADALYVTNRINEAIQVTYKIVYLDEENNDARYMLIWYHLLDGQIDKAGKLLSDASNTNPSDEDFNKLSGYLSLSEGKLNEAHDILAAYLISTGNEDKVDNDLDKLKEYGLIEGNTLTLFKDSLVFIDSKRI